MSASAEAALRDAISEAQVARRDSRMARDRERQAMMAFIDEALLHGWSWDRMGDVFQLTGTAVRRYYDRNKRRVHSV